MPGSRKSILSVPWICGGIAIFVCMLWGLDFVLIKLGYSVFSIESGNTGDILLFAGVRFIISGTVTLSVLSAARKELAVARGETFRDVCALAVFQTIGQYVLLYLGMARTSAVRTSIIDSTLVFFSILIASVVFHQEKLTRNKIIGCICGLSGIIVMNLGGDTAGSALTGDMLVLLCAVFTGLSHSLVKKFSQRGDPAFLSGWQLLLGGVALAVVGMLMGGNLRASASGALAVLAGLALISSVTGALWNALIKHNPVSSVNIYFFSNPLFGVLFSALILGEAGQVMRAQNVLALALVCVGILIINLNHRNRT